jgi:hypothetical protein
VSSFVVSRVDGSSVWIWMMRVKSVGRSVFHPPGHTAVSIKDTNNGLEQSF